MATADIDMHILAEDQEPRGEDREEVPLVREFRAEELLPEVKGRLHDLLQRQPAVLGSLQIMSGFFTVGIGIFFAVTQLMSQSLLTLFRVSHLTGVLFIFAGTVSNLLCKYPELLSVSLRVNCGCIVVAVTGACLVGVDLAKWDSVNEPHLKLEALTLCVMGLEVLLSAILCVWFSREIRAKSP